MQKIILSLVVLLATSMTSFAQSGKGDIKVKTPITIVEEEVVERAEGEGPIMTLESDVVDYGTIEQHGEPLRVLKFTNTGTEPLVIKNARGSCGCTVPTWPKEPIMPGEESEIEVRYATNRLGKINKTIKITTNQGGDPQVIKVVGTVLAAEKEEAVPAAEPSILKDGQ